MPAVKFENWVTADVLPQIRKTGGYIPVQPGESDEETIRHAEEILRATLKEKENLLKNQQVQIDQQKKLIGEQDTEIRRLNGVVDEQEQNGVTVPSKAATILAPTPWKRPKICLLLSGGK